MENITLANKDISDLEKYFKNNNDKLILKWSHYFDIYERHFSRFRNKEIVILEVGISQGGSLQMWKNYFGDKAKIYGIDIDARCKDFEEENIQIFIGSQSDRKFLEQVKTEMPPIDILIDDGGHTMKQQITTYKMLFEHVKNNGVYLCEDVHTSYWLKWGGGFKRRGTFIEFSKSFIDQLQAFHSRQKGLKANNFTKSVDSIHYYDSVIVIEKRAREKPYELKSGEVQFSIDKKFTFIGKLGEQIAYGTFLIINRVLKFFRLPGYTWP